MLAELSTPLIPITDAVLIMPLIGTLDAQRTRQATATLLTGIATSRAQTVIVDSTGVPVLDAPVANVLLHATQAAHRLGARVLLTGACGPRWRKRWWGFQAIQTFTTLQQGIGHALHQP